MQLKTNIYTYDVICCNLQRILMKLLELYNREHYLTAHFSSDFIATFLQVLSNVGNNMFYILKQITANVMSVYSLLCPRFMYACHFVWLHQMLNLYLEVMNTIQICHVS